MSGMDSSDSSDDAPDVDLDQDTKLYPPPLNPLFPQKSDSPDPSKVLHNKASTTTSASNSSTINKTQNTAASSTSQSSPMIPPLLYQTSQGMMYTSPSNVILSLAQDSNSSQGPQFITIPLSMMSASTSNGQGELDLSKRK